MAASSFVVVEPTAAPVADDIDNDGRRRCWAQASLWPTPISPTVVVVVPTDDSWSGAAKEPTTLPVASPATEEHSEAPTIFPVVVVVPANEPPVVATGGGGGGQRGSPIPKNRGVNMH